MLRSPTHHHHHHHHLHGVGGGVVVGHGPTSTGSEQQHHHQMTSTTQSAAAQATIVAGGVGVGGRSIFKMNGSVHNNTTSSSNKTINNNFNHLNNNNNNNNHIPMTPPLTPINQSPPPPRTSLFDSCHRKIRLIGGGPFVFLGGLVAKARRKDRDGEQNQSDTKLYLEESVLERKLPDADLKDLVDLPSGLDYNEWLASHTLALFEHVNLVYGTISEFCTTSSCPDMTGPGTRMYLWFDEKGKKTRVAAPQYIDYVMTFTQKTVSDEQIFPTKYANEFPTSFEMIARKILRLLFHVIAHLYAGHFREIALLGLHTHLNLTFAHLTALHRKFNLIDSKETEVLRDLELALRLTDNSSIQTGTVASATSTTTTATSTSTTTATNSTTSDYIATDEQHHHQQSNNYLCQTIDGDASIQPIVTQPESASLIHGATTIIQSATIATGTNYQPFNHSCHQNYHHHLQHHNQPYLYSDSNNCETGGGNCGGGCGNGNGGNGVVVIGGISSNNYGVVIGGGSGTGSPSASATAAAATTTTTTQQQQQPSA